MKWSDFQNEIFYAVDETEDNIVIDALAGSGKSTVLFKIARILKHKSILFFAFNSHIEQYASKKLKSCTNVKVRTTHSYGLSCIKASPKFKHSEMDVTKVWECVQKEVNNFQLRGTIFNALKALRTFGCLEYDAKNIINFVLENPSINDQIGDLKSLRTNAALLGSLLKKLDADIKIYDFDDMLRFPILYKLMNYGYIPEVLLVDECFPYYTPVMVDYNKWVSIGEIVTNPNLYTHVLSYDLEQKKILPKKITGRMQKETDRLLEICIENQNGSEGYFRCTPNHKLHLVGKGTTYAEDATVNDEIIVGLDIAGNELHGSIIAIETVNTTQLVYDINVEDTHLFWIGACNNEIMQFPVLVHNCQDLSLYQFEYVKFFLLNQVRVIVVGDENQAIYSFRGANGQALSTITEMSKATRLPLSITYRCKSNIVRFVKRLYRDEEDHEAPPIIAAQEGGKVIQMEGMNEDLYCLGTLLKSGTEMIVSPKNKHIISIWFELLEHYSTPSSLKGSNICAMLTKLFKATKQTVKFSQAEGHLLIMAKSEDETIADMAIAGCRFLQLQKFKNYEEVFDKIRQLEKDNNSKIHLHTVHSSKGLEADNVFVINDFFDSEQKINMQYVAYTRASDKLYVVNLPKPKFK